MSGFLTKAKNAYINIMGFHTNRKLVVLESDDWGSIRMPSKETFERLKSLGDNPDADGFLSNDCLESESDLEALYKVLGSVTDGAGKTPVLTANFAVANPNFDKINLEEGIYEYEPFYETYKKYYGENRVLDIIKDGYSRGLFFPQLHCREHLNVGRWMRDIQQRKPDTVLAFENKTMGVGASFCETNRFGYMDAFNTDCASDEKLAEILEDSIKMFEEIFGYKSSTFVASCFVWNEQLEECLNRNGIRYIQSAPWQNKPIGTNGVYKLKRVLHYTGQRNKNGQLYSVRNCDFEPAYNQDPNAYVNSCIREISLAFKANKPVIISTHRFNYIGSINPQNREDNLKGLKLLLDSIVEQYPDVEFVTSEELFNIMVQEKK